MTGYRTIPRILSILLVLAAVAASTLVVTQIQQGGLTGLAIAAQGPANILYLPPTPDNGSIINAPWIAINASYTGNMTLATLSWRSNNISMETSNGLAHAIVNGTGIISFIITGIDNEGNISNSDERIIIIGYVNWTPIADQTIPENTRFDLDTHNLLSSIKPKSQIGLSIGLDRSDILSCGITSARYVNCTTTQDATGTTALTIVADDGAVSTPLTFNITVTPVNQPPRLIRTIPSRTLHSNNQIEMELNTHFRDPESDTITYSLNAHTSNGNIDMPYTLSTGGVLRLTPNATTSGEHNYYITANDSINISYSNNFTINITPNGAPRIITRITTLTLNESKAYRLRFTQIFSDPDGDPLAYSYQNMSLAKLTRERGYLYIIPYKNTAGSDQLYLNATDGQATTAWTIPVNVIYNPDNSNQNQASTPTQQTQPAQESNAPTGATPAGQTTDLTKETVESTVTQKLLSIKNGGIPDQTMSSGDKIQIDLSEYMDLSQIDLTSMRVLTKGTNQVVLQKTDGYLVTLASAPGWAGSENIQFMVVDKDGHATSNEFKVTAQATEPAQPDLEKNTNPTGQTRPALKKPLPAITFNENQTSITLDMNEYFTDPSGRGLDFLVEPKTGLSTKINSRSIISISLAAPGTTTINDTIKIIAKDSSGNIGSGAMSVNVIDALNSNQETIDLTLQALIAFMLIVVLALIYMRNYYEPAPRRETGGLNWKEPQPASSFLQDIAADWLSILNPPKSSRKRQGHGSGETGYIELKREALLMREGIAAIKAIAASTEDNLIRAALDKEQEKLSKALHLIQNSTELSRQDFKRLVLYTKEVTASIVQIVDMSEEYLITHELKREAVRMSRLTQDLEVKLSYMGGEKF